MNDVTLGNIPDWFVAFQKRDRWWHPPGRFGHVSCIGYSPETSTWLLYDFSTEGVNFRIAFAFDDVEDLLNHFWVSSVVVRAPAVPPRTIHPLRFILPAPFTCVGSAKRLLGLPSRAITPDGLYRDMIRLGCQIANPVH